MRTRFFALVSFALFFSTFAVFPAWAQDPASSSSQQEATVSKDNSQDNSNSQADSNAQTNSNDTFEGTVVSRSRSTLVLRTDDNQFHLFTYEQASTRPVSLTAGSRVRVTAGSADENGTRVATSVTVVSASGGTATRDKGAQAAPVPEKVRDIESDIKRESKRWRLGVRAGAAFDPELFMFGVHTQMGPIFHPRVLFRPSAEFDFGEVTDLIALNFEPIYRFSANYRKGDWTPYVGAGPAMIFIHQSFNGGRNISFGNFDYETGFNVLAGVQSRKGTFVELKTSLWSGPAPKLRLIVGYNF
ncbi:MAG TPA: hypothetical protein VHV29_04615 [Terriglobales bacterium]|jgi:opacity protein-like surface antigen|nr:hypothetical protein [Terriglobales bacterium]